MVKNRPGQTKKSAVRSVVIHTSSSESSQSCSSGSIESSEENYILVTRKVQTTHTGTIESDKKYTQQNVDLLEENGNILKELIAEKDDEIKVLKTQISSK